MPPLVQAPTTITITLTIERRSARDKDLVAFLERELRKAMQHAQYATPAGSTLLDMDIQITNPEPTYAAS